MKANLSQYKQVESGKIALTGNNNDQTQGELLWLNLKNYDQIIDSLDEYGKLDETQSYERFSCEPITNEPPYRAITPTLVRAWSYKII